MSQWLKWERIHSAIAEKSFDSVSPQEWHAMLKKTLSSTSTSECQNMPSVCCHCHQLVALSSVTLVLLQMQPDENHKIEAYIKPLLLKDILLNIVRLIKHPCCFMQYHARRTLVTLLHHSETKEAVGHVVEMCVDNMQQPLHSSRSCLESLQLLCGLVSSKAGCISKVQCFAVLQKTLPALILQYACVDSITTKPGEECISVASIHSLTDAGDQRPCVEMTAKGDTCRISVPQASFYLCLWLLQKTFKYASSLSVPERVEAFENMFETTLKVTLDYLLKHLNGNVQEKELLALRKCLEVWDAALHFSGLEKSDSLDSISARVATEFLKRLQATHCAWSFPCERIFVGGVSQTQKMLMSQGAVYRSLDSPLTYNVMLGLLVQVTLKASAICARVAAHSSSRFSSADTVCLCSAVLLSMHSAIKMQIQPRASKEPFPRRDKIGWLPLLYGAQDDHWLEALLSLLNIYVCVEKLTRNAEKFTEETHHLLSLADPHTQFIQLLHFISFDDSLLIDWLTAPETCFLQYFTHYLRVLVADFKALVASVTDFLSGTISVSVPEDQAELFHTVPCKNPEQFADSHLLVGTKALPCENRTGITASKLTIDKQGYEEQKEQIDDSAMQYQHKPAASALSRFMNDSFFSERQQEKIRMKHSSSDCVKDVMQHSTGLSLLANYADEPDDESEEDDVDVNSCVGEEDRRGSVQMSGDSNIRNSDSGACSISASNCSGKFCLDREPMPFRHTCISANTCHLKGREFGLALDSQMPEMTCSNCEPVSSAGPALEDCVESQSDECDYVGKVIRLLHKVGLKLRRLYGKGLLAYNPRPLLVLLDRCDQLYTENSTS